MQETMVQFAARRGFTWKEWLALPQSRRYEEAAVDSGVEVTEDMRRGWRIHDVPVEGGARLAAFKAALTASRASE